VTIGAHDGEVFECNFPTCFWGFVQRDKVVYLGVTLSECPVSLLEIKLASRYFARQLAGPGQSVFDLLPAHCVLSSAVENEALALLTFKTCNLEVAIS
jgi:hypothetical protein